MVSDRENEPELDRVLTVPNALSGLRLVLLAVFGVLLFVDDLRVLAALVLGLAGVTDFLDGYVARRFHQVSVLGKILDPTVDRIVLTMSIVSIVAYGAVPVWLAVLVIAREAFVSVMAIVLASMGARRIEVLWVGKAGTFGLMVCLPLFLGGHGPGTWARVLTDVTWVLIVPALAASFAATVAYVPLARAALAEGRQASGTVA
jgi:cardiolipin synthase